MYTDNNYVPYSTITLQMLIESSNIPHSIYFPSSLIKSAFSKTFGALPTIGIYTAWSNATSPCDERSPILKSQLHPRSPPYTQNVLQTVQPREPLPSPINSSPTCCRRCRTSNAAQEIRQVRCSFRHCRYYRSIVMVPSTPSGLASYFNRVAQRPSM